MASMASGCEHARRTSQLGDVFEVMQAYSHIVGGMRGLREKDFELDPCTSSAIVFVETSNGGMQRSLAQHARIVARDVRPSACTVEGGGIAKAFTAAPSTLSVRAVDCQGQPCSEGGDSVGIKLMGVLEHAEEAADAAVQVDLARDVSVVDAGDGTYTCTYSVVKGAAAGQTARLEVRVNGGHVSGSPFQVPIVAEVVLAFDGSPFTDKDVLYHIATAGGTRAYSNPHDAGLVVASMSSLGGNGAHGSASRFVQGRQHDGDYNYTGNTPQSWMAVDLKRGLLPTHYCLRSDKHTVNHKPRQWRLEGSNDSSKWTTLREHVNDASLGGEAFSVASWPIEAEGKAFRHFRILQTGPNSSNHNNLMCTGIELYGTLLAAKAE